MSTLGNWGASAGQRKALYDVNNKKKPSYHFNFKRLDGFDNNLDFLKFYHLNWSFNSKLDF